MFFIVSSTYVLGIGVNNRMKSDVLNLLNIVPSPILGIGVINRMKNPLQASYSEFLSTEDSCPPPPPPKQVVQEIQSHLPARRQDFPEGSYNSDFAIPLHTYSHMQTHTYTHI